MKVICNYCSCKADLVSGDAIYPHRPDLSYLKFYRCGNCDAYVGTHKGTIRPLGTLANTELRQYRSQTHSVFDPLWKNGKLTRTMAYAKLAKRLGIHPSRCHIAMFDIDTCKRVIALCTFGELQHA